MSSTSSLVATPPIEAAQPGYMTSLLQAKIFWTALIRADFGFLTPLKPDRNNNYHPRGECKAAESVIVTVFRGEMTPPGFPSSCSLVLETHRSAQHLEVLDRSAEHSKARQLWHCCSGLAQRSCKSDAMRRRPRRGLSSRGPQAGNAPSPHSPRPLPFVYTYIPCLESTRTSHAGNTRPRPTRSVCDFH